MVQFNILNLAWKHKQATSHQPLAQRKNRNQSESGKCKNNLCSTLSLNFAYNCTTKFDSNSHVNEKLMDSRTSSWIKWPKF
jgi:hypothetical protein